MKNHSPWLLLSLMVFLVSSLSACERRIKSDQADPGATPFRPPPVTLAAGAVEGGAVHTPTPTQILDSRTPTATPVRFLYDPSLPRSFYKMSVDFDYARHKLDVFQELTYINRSSDPLDELVLLVEPNRYPGVFHLDELTWRDREPVVQYILKGNQLTIPLPAPLHPWESVVIHITFRLDLPDRRGPFGYTSRQANLGDWYPSAPLYQSGHGWLALEPGIEGVGEYLTYDVADYEVQFQLIDPPENLTLAASAPSTVEGDWHIFTVKAARNFTISASPEYETAVDERGFVRAQAYFFPEHRAAGEAAVATTAAALELYAEMFGPLTHESLSVVEAEFRDGMEYDGLYFLGIDYYETFFGGPLNLLTALAAHETAHQWWYGLVANNPATEPWLDEALATYCEKLYFEKYHPDFVDWWWEFRIDLYEPTGWVDSMIYDHDGFRPYVNAVYLQGVSFLETLREQIGDEAFFATLREYLTRQSYGQGTTEDFVGFLRAETDKNLTLLFREYFSSPP